MNPIIDKRIIENSEHSYCGNDLLGKQVMLVCNQEVDAALVGKIFAREGVLDYGLLCEENDDILIAKLQDINMEKYDHIINIIDTDRGKDVFFSVYQIIQKEYERIKDTVDKEGYVTIVIIFLCGKNEEIYIGECVREGFSGFIEGLEKIFGLCRILISGIIADRKSNLEIPLNISCFLSSRYGALMSGQVFNIEK